MWGDVCDTVLFHKKGPAARIHNWRPISLLSHLHKILSFILMHRLNRWLKGILHPSQTGFLPGVDGTHVHLASLYTALAAASAFTNPLHIMFLDFQNAYGSVSHAYIKWCLRTRGLDPTSRMYKYMCALMDTMQMRVRTAEGQTAPIPIRRGVVQGDHLSVLVFLLALDPIVRRLHSTHTGFRLPQGGPQTDAAPTPPAAHENDNDNDENSDDDDDDGNESDSSITSTLSTPHSPLVPSPMLQDSEEATPSGGRPRSASLPLPPSPLSPPPAHHLLPRRPPRTRPRVLPRAVPRPPRPSSPPPPTPPPTAPPPPHHPSHNRPTVQVMTPRTTRQGTRLPASGAPGTTVVSPSRTRQGREFTARPTADQGSRMGGRGVGGRVGRG